MQIVELKYKTFSFPLNEIIKTSGQKITGKKVILLKARNSIGNVTFAEISPLKNFSKETVEECENILKKTIGDIIKFPVGLEELKIKAGTFQFFPSLKFAFEQLYLNFSLMQNQKSYMDLIKRNEIKINGMVSIKPLEETLREISVLIEKGCNVIKLKVGRKNFDKDLEIIKRIIKTYGNKIKLRLDANGSWQCNDAINYLHELSELDIEYIEEPVETRDELINLAAVSKINLVPDESIETYKDAVEFIETGYFDFLVLKPAIRTGIFDTIKIIRLAEEKNINVIITSSFETAIGRSALLYLASLTKHNYAHGLGVETLGKNILKNHFIPKNGTVHFNIKDLIQNFDLDF
jgi:o-succinylbenzoate synthase